MNLSQCDGTLLWSSVNYIGSKSEPGACKHCFSFHRCCLHLDVSKAEKLTHLIVKVGRGFKKVTQTNYDDLMTFLVQSLANSNAVGRPHRKKNPIVDMSPKIQIVS